ncbi:MAG: ATP-binding protein, partial [Acidobacteriota bacterium]|nr:ATP-binding protein [Acidobacteriota bacterium]
MSREPALRFATVVVVLLAAVGPLLHAQADGDFVPVTDAMLEDPAPGDWLHWRRTQDGWAYSPLDQIDRENVGELTLAWSRGLEEGSQQGTPLVYDGVMYYPNPSSVTQAI